MYCYTTGCVTSSRNVPEYLYIRTQLASSVVAVVGRDRLFGEAILRELSRAVVEIHLKSIAGEDISLDTSTFTEGLCQWWLKF